MPAQEYVTGVARVACRGTSQGQSIVNVFHVRNGSTFGAPYQQAGMTAMVTAFAAAYGARFRPFLNSSWSGDEAIGIDLSGPLGVSYQRAIVETGAVSGGSVPQSAACCVSWRIDRHYRGGHPRTYIGPLGTSAIENQTSIPAAFITSVVAGMNSFLSDINALVCNGIPQRLIAVHRVLNNAVLAPPLQSDLLSAVCDTRIDTQRRRLGPDR